MAQHIWYWIGRFLVALYARWILRIDIQSKQNMPEGAKIIIANHPSTTDPAWITVAFQERVSILINGLLFNLPGFGRSLRMSGHIPVVAASQGGTTIEDAVDQLRAGRTVVIFPEGDLSAADGSLKKGHSGAARLALLTGAPVIAVGIGLMREKLRTVPVRLDGVADTGLYYLNGPYSMTLGEVMYFRGDVDNRAQVNQVLEQMMDALALLSRESQGRVRAAAPRGFSMGQVVGLIWQLFARLLYRLA